MTFPQSDPTVPTPGQPPVDPTFGAAYPPPTVPYPPAPAGYGQTPGSPPPATYPPAGPAVPPPYGYYNPSAQTNTMAILSLVFAFVFAPLGIVFGHIARKQIRERGEGGSGLATAGLWCSYIFTLLQIVLCIGYIVLVATVASNGNFN